MRRDFEKKRVRSAFDRHDGDAVLGGIRRVVRLEEILERLGVNSRRSKNRTTTIYFDGDLKKMTPGSLFQLKLQVDMV